MPSYRALVSFPHGKNRLAVGETFEVKEQLGNFYVKTGMAEDAEAGSPVPKPAPKPAEVETEEVTKEEEPEPAEKKPRHYARRDMMAEKAGRTGKKKA